MLDTDEVIISKKAKSILGMSVFTLIISGFSTGLIDTSSKNLETRNIRYVRTSLDGTQIYKSKIGGNNFRLLKYSNDSIIIQQTSLNIFRRDKIYIDNDGVFGLDSLIVKMKEYASGTPECEESSKEYGKIFSKFEPVIQAHNSNFIIE